MSVRTKVFISYSHEDEDWLKRLRVHLKPLERDHGIDIWDDTKIVAGSKWREEIETAVGSAKVAVLLISASFLASDFITSDELPSLLKASEKEGATILPVIISSSRFQKTDLSQFQSVNSPSAPLIGLSRGEQEAVWEEVVEAIEEGLGSSLKPARPIEEKVVLQTGLTASETAHASNKIDSYFSIKRFYELHKNALTLGFLIILVALALLIIQKSGKFPVGSVPGILIILGAVTAIFAWIPFRINIKGFSLTSPPLLSYRLLIFTLGVLVLSSGYALFVLAKDGVSEPTIRTYFAYIILSPSTDATTFAPSTSSTTPTFPPNCHVTYHVAIRLEVPEGEKAVYIDRITSSGGGTALNSNPKHTLLNPEQWPTNSSLLQFKIEEDRQPNNVLNFEAAAFLNTRVTPDYLKVGPHLPYRTEFVVVVVDYSRLGFIPSNDVRGQIVFPGPGGENQTKALELTPHPSVNDGTFTLIGRDLPADSSILLRWGTDRPLR